MVAKRGNGEGSISQGKDGRWVARISLPGGKRKAFYGPTRAAVAKRLANAIRDRDKGLPIADSRLTVKDYLEHWHQFGSRHVQPSTLAGYESHMRVHLIPHIGHLPLTALSPRHVEQLIADLEVAGLSPSTIGHIRATLRRALGQAVRQGLVVRNVAAGALCTVPRIERKEVRVPTPEEARAILAAFDGHWLEAAVAVSIGCGLRQGELRALRWADVDLDGGRLTVRQAWQRSAGAWHLAEPKTAASRAPVAIPASVVATLRLHKAAEARERLAAGRHEDSGAALVFTTRSGRPLDPSDMLKAFRRRLAGAGLPEIRWHDLRHACASLLLADGLDVVAVAAVLRHASPTTTLDTYAHALPGGVDAAAVRMDAILTGRSEARAKG